MTKIRHLVTPTGSAGPGAARLTPAGAHAVMPRTRRNPSSLLPIRHPAASVAHPVIEHIPRLRRYARALTGNPFRADDLVQDTLERAVRKFRLWRPGDLRAWLFSLMHNVFVNQLKARRISPDVELDENVAAPPPSASGDDIADLQRSLMRLAPEQREILLLVALEDMTYAEVSRALGIPMGTVMSRLSRGRERLKKLMDGEDPKSSLRVVR